MKNHENPKIAVLLSLNPVYYWWHSFHILILFRVTKKIRNLVLQHLPANYNNVTVNVTVQWRSNDFIIGGGVRLIFQHWSHALAGCIVRLILPVVNCFYNHKKKNLLQNLWIILSDYNENYLQTVYYLVKMIQNNKRLQGVGYIPIILNPQPPPPVRPPLHSVQRTYPKYRVSLRQRWKSQAY